VFDAVTTALIAEAPALDGVDLGALPQLLTDAYASIVAARIRLREDTNEPGLPPEVGEIVGRMKRLAFTYEALVTARLDRANRAAAAFVAGAAHTITLMADKARNTAPRPSRLDYQSVSSAVSASLLFLIAEASADAAEMAKLIVVQTDNVVEATLLNAISHLSHGRLKQIIDLKIPTPSQITSGSNGEEAVTALYFLLLQGVRTLASNMLGVNGIVEAASDNAIEVFEHVKSLCTENLNDVFDDPSRHFYSVYPGPLHLASLLSAVGKDLSSSALVNVSPPAGINHHRWVAVMRELAVQRPYLWRNHRQAISAGYLNTGVSAAVSFPTGAGKSTLSELKVAAALLRGKKVVFLAPTLSLVDQTARALAASFPQADVQRERAEESLLEAESETLPAISVMTPERCLAILGFDREAFMDVGLLVFDECHLLHPRDSDRSRRAVDAMLCVLNVTAIAQDADLLFLSAMMSNCDEMAQWLKELTGRPCLSLNLTWKPTRQVRGCVVYGEDEIGALNAKLKQTRSKVTQKSAPAALLRSLHAHPFGFFCLHQTWQSQARRDYALIPLLNEAIKLSTGTAKNHNWYLTPNGNQVAAALAAATGRQRLKTLVFTQTVPLANSASIAVSDSLGSPNVQLTESEKLFYAAAIDEAGGPERVYLDVDSEGVVNSASACHHSLLLPVERYLHEALFRRPDGLHVLVATSTLAQGMNLPSEVVIIGGDSRFDPGADRMQKLEAHELLNAAGRAGRAGDGAYGFVLVVPSKVVHFNNNTNSIHNHWSDLRSIFSQSDQCLEIEDPLTALLDQIHVKASPLSETATYLLGRLPVGDSMDGDGDATARKLLSRSFGAYQARARKDEAWINTRVESAITTRRSNPDAAAVLTWADRLAAAAGIPVLVVRALGESLSQSIDPSVTLRAWYNWLAAWLVSSPQLIPQLIRRETLDGLFGASYRSLMSDQEKGAFAAPILFAVLERWMAGDSLAALELIFGTKEKKVGKCETAREFVLRIVPELAYVFSAPAQILRALREEGGDDREVPVTLAMLGSCVKEGFDQVEKLALRQHHRGHASRRQIHREFASIENYVPLAASGENFAATISRIETALSIADLF
jgi:superfamily II DNA/RNA helicase